MRTSVRHRPNPLLPTDRNASSRGTPTFVGRFAVALAVGALFLSAGTGCDRSTASADREVKRAINEASAKLGAGQAADAVKTLEAAAGNTAASEAMKIQAKAQLATAQLAAGGDAGLRLSAKSADAVRLIHECELLSIRIRIGNTMAAGYSKLDPQQIQTDTQARIAAANGGANQATFPASDDGKTTLPTLAASKQRVSELQADIAKRKAAVDELDKQRQAALAKADELQKAADDTQGQAVLQAYKRASDQRRVASDLGSKVDVARAQIMPVEHELAVAEAQQQEIEHYIAALGDQSKQRAAGWETLQKQVAAQQAVNKAIVMGSGEVATEATIGTKIKALSDALKEADSLKTEAEGLLTGAVKNFGDAAAAAEDLRRVIRGGPSKSGFDSNLAKVYGEAYDPAYYKMQVGIAQTELANLYAAEAHTLAARATMLTNLKEAAGAAGVQLPAEADDAKAAAEAKEALAKADAAYKEATDTLASAADSVQGNDARESHAKMAQIFALYGWAKLQSASGNRTDAQKNVQAAIALRDGLLQSESAANTVVLPAELTPAPKAPPPPTSAPAAGAGAATPAAAGATTPAAGGAAAPAAGAPATTPPAAPAAPAAPAPAAH